MGFQKTVEYLRTVFRFDWVGSLVSVPASLATLNPSVIR